jgi:rod shape-determining protein MreC
VRDSRRNRFVLGTLLLVALLLITIDYRGGQDSPLRGLRGVGAAVFGPIERTAAAVVRPVGSTVDAIIDAPGEHRKAERLQRENERLRRQIQSGQLDKGRAAQLERLLRPAGLGDYRIVAAEVISAGQGFEDTVTINAGSSSGVRPDMTVMAADGLVGRITRVGPSTATVLLATDAASAVGSRVEGSMQIGITQGRGRRGIGGTATPLSFQLLDANAPISTGQRIVTLGSDGERPYVPGMPIGTVARVERTPGSLTRTAFVRPFVHFASLDVVGVVVAPPKTDPHDSLLPPKPAGPAKPANTAKPAKPAATPKPSNAAEPPKPRKPTRPSTPATARY